MHTHVYRGLKGLVTGKAETKTETDRLQRIRSKAPGNLTCIRGET